VLGITYNELGFSTEVFEENYVVHGRVCLELSESSLPCTYSITAFISPPRDGHMPRSCGDPGMWDATAERREFVKYPTMESTDENTTSSNATE
jgi:hypothetical protein